MHINIQGEVVGIESLNVNMAGQTAADQIIMSQVIAVWQGHFGLCYLGTLHGPLPKRIPYNSRNVVWN